MHGPEQLSNERLLRRAIDREVELKRTVEKLERNVTELKQRASELERERDEAREALSVGRRPYEKLKEKYRKEKAAHRDAKEGLIAVQVASFILLALLVGSVLLGGSCCGSRMNLFCYGTTWHSSFLVPRQALLPHTYSVSHEPDGR